MNYTGGVHENVITSYSIHYTKLYEKLVSSKDELTGSISGQTDKLFKGWRYDFFGRSVESFLNTSSKFEISAVKSANNITKIQSNLVENNCC